MYAYTPGGDLTFFTVTVEGHTDAIGSDAEHVVRHFWNQSGA